MSKAREPLSLELRLTQLWKIVERLARETAKAAIGAHQETHQVGGTDSLVGLLDANARVGVRSQATDFDDSILALPQLRGYWILDDPRPTANPTSPRLAAAAAPGLGSRLRLNDTSGAYDPVHQIAGPGGFAPVQTTYFLGNQFQSGTPGENAAVNTIRAVREHVPHAGTIQTVKAWLDGSGPGTGSQRVRAVLYSDDGGATPRPLSKLAESAEIVVSDGQSAGTITFSFPGPISVTANAHVWIGFIFDSNTNTIRLKAAGSGDGARTLTTGVSYAAGAPPSWDATADTAGTEIVAYCHLIATPTAAFGLDFNGPASSSSGPVESPLADSVEHVPGVDGIDWLGSWTIGGWFFFNTLPSGGQDAFHGLMGSNPAAETEDKGGGIFLGEAGELYVWRSDGASGVVPTNLWSTATDRHARTADGTIVTGRWYFIVATASDNELALWVDGQKRASTVPYNASGAQLGPVKIGGLPRRFTGLSITAYLRGAAHRVFIAQTQITDPADIAALFQAGTGTAPDTTFKRRRLNILPSDGITISLADDATDEEVDVSIGLRATLDSTALTQVRRNSAGTVVTRHRLNLVEGQNISILLTDDEVDDEADVTIRSLGAGTAAFGTVTIRKNGADVGRRHNLNFIEGQGITLTITDDSDADNEIDIQIASTGDNGVAVHRTAGTVVATGVATPIPWTHEEWDTDAYHSIVSNIGSVVVPAGLGGKYLLDAAVQWEANGSGTYRALDMIVDGGSAFRVWQPPVVGVRPTTSFFVHELNLNAGQSVSIQGEHDSGGPLEIEAVGTTLDYSTEVLVDAPWGYWKMNEASGNPQDSSGNARHLTAGGTLTYENPIDAVNFPGVGNKAIEGDGTNGECHRTGAGDPAALTYEAIVSIQEAVTTSLAPVLANGKPTHEANGSGVHIDSGTGKFTVYINGGASACKADAAAVQGTTYHLVVTYDGATWRMYINGVLQAATATTDPGSPTTNAIQTMGVQGASGTFHSKMRTAHLALYTTALSSARVTAHYTAAAPQVAGLALPRLTLRRTGS